MVPFVVPITALYGFIVEFTNGNTPAIVGAVGGYGHLLAPNQFVVAWFAFEFRSISALKIVDPGWFFLGADLLIMFAAACALGWLLQRIQAKWNFATALAAYAAVSIAADGLLWAADVALSPAA